MSGQLKRYITLNRFALLQVVLPLSVIAAYLVPEWLAFLRSDVNVFVNAWDEENYLSWQGVYAARNNPGYFVLYLNWFLHKLGFSGAAQNLLFDTLIPPFVVFLVYRTLRYADIPPVRALGYAVVVSFSSVIFNYADPLVSLILGPYDPTGFLMAGWERYPTILRTPNPQVSYLLIAISVYWSFRYRRWWLLLLPLPLLYYFVAVVYSYVLVSTFLYVQLTSRRLLGHIPAVVISPLIGYVSIGAGLVFVFYFSGLFDASHPYRLNSLLFVESRQFQIPIGLVLLAIGVATILLFLPTVRDSRLATALLLLSLVVVGSVNFHLLTGFMLSQKNYYDYGISVPLGMLLVLALELLASDNQRRIALSGVVLVIALLTATTQVPWYKQAVSVSKKLSPAYEVIRENPLGAIIPDLGVSSKVAYSGAQLLAPPYSYQYYFGVGQQCPEYRELLERSFSFVLGQKQLETKTVELLRKTKQTILNYQTGRSRLRDQNVPPYCKELEANNRHFYVVDLK